MALLQPFDQRHNIAVRHLFRLNVSLAFPGLFHLSHGGTGRCNEASFLPMFVPLTIRRWSLH